MTSPLQSGKEADVFIVEREDAAYIAKVYRDRSVRSFKNDAGYREGRTGRSSRGERAMRKNSKYGQGEMAPDIVITSAPRLFAELRFRQRGKCRVRMYGMNRIFNPSSR